MILVDENKPNEVIENWGEGGGEIIVRRRAMNEMLNVVRLWKKMKS